MTDFLFGGKPKLDGWELLELQLLTKTCCSTEEKRTCLVILENGLKMQALARREGFLAWGGDGMKSRFSFIERKGYMLAAHGASPVALRSILLRYIIGSGLRGRKLFQGLVALQTVLFVQSDDDFYGKEHLQAMFGIELQAEIACLFAKESEADAQEHWRAWICCASCSTAYSECFRENGAKEKSPQLVRLENVVAVLDKAVLQKIFQQIETPFDPQMVKTQLADPFSALNWSLVFHLLTDCVVKRKLHQSMTATVSQAVYAAKTWMGPVRVDDCLQAVKNIALALETIGKG